MVRCLAGLVVGCSVFIACAEPGGRATFPPETVDVAEVEAEVFVPPDQTGPEPEPEVVEVLPETVAETLPEVETAAETSPEVVETEVVDCEQGCLPISVTGAPTGVQFRQFPSQARPTLRGGEAPSGAWVLRGINFYSSGTFATGIEVVFSNHGATAGRIAFEGEALAMALDLDLDVTVTAFGTTASDSARSVASLGGCHEVVGSRFFGSFGSCGAGLETERALDYENGAQLIIGVEMSREALIGLLPPDQQEAGEFAIVGPMYLVSTFEKP